MAARADAPPDSESEGDYWCESEDDQQEQEAETELELTEAWAAYAAALYGQEAEAGEARLGPFPWRPVDKDGQIRV